MAEEIDPNIVARCSDCGWAMSMDQALNDPFLQQGNSQACKSCGGVVVVTHVEDPMKRPID